MGFESNTGLNVNNHYGQRKIGGQQGVLPSAGAENEAVVNFDGDALGFKPVLPNGAVVTEIVDDFATGAVSTATVGATNVAAADGTSATYVATSGGDLTISGPTAGKVIVKYLHVV